MADEQSSPDPPFRKNWFAHADYGGWVIAIVGIIISIALSVYFYYKSERHPQPVFVQDSLPLPVVDQNQISGIPVKLTDRFGSPISKNLYTSRIILWNRGNASLKPEQILKPIRITLRGPDFTIDAPEQNKGGVSLLSARVERFSRDVVNPTITITNNEVGVEFRILEPDDGFSVQFNYLANSPVSLTLNGAIEGERLLAFRSLKDIATRHMAAWIIALTLQIIGLVLIILPLIAMKKGRDGAIWRYSKRLGGGAPILLMAGAILFSVAEKLDKQHVIPMDKWETAQPLPQPLPMGNLHIQQ
jgi:hypothetical protein